VKEKEHVQAAEREKVIKSRPTLKRMPKVDCMGIEADSATKDK
jgi:hypothetical protein